MARAKLMIDDDDDEEEEELTPYRYNLSPF